MRPTRHLVLALAAAAAVAVGTSGSSSARGRDPAGWVASWAASPVPPAGRGPLHRGMDDVTYREIVHLSRGGSALRVRLTNVYGDRPVRFDPVSVGTPDGGAAVAAASLRLVTFGGADAVTVPPGDEVTSDPVPVQVGDGSDLAVSLHVLGRSGPPTRHPHSYATAYAGKGDLSTRVGGDAFGTRLASWFFLDGISVRAPGTATIVALGDSITDGARSTPDTNSRWPDLLAQRLRASGAPLAVVNAGISGNQVLAALHSGTGEPALGRLDEDVLSQPGVTDVIVLEGINDIRAGTQTPALLAGYRQIIVRCHSRDLRVIGGTLLPFRGDRGWSPARERTRQQVNAWIRTSSAFDGVVDFDAAVRDARHPDRIRAADDGGDHLHPGDAGYAAMAQAVDLRIFTPRSG